MEPIRTVSVCSSAVRYNGKHDHDFLVVSTDKTVVSRVHGAKVMEDKKEAVEPIPICYRDGKCMPEVCRFYKAPVSEKDEILQRCNALARNANFERVFFSILWEVCCQIQMFCTP